MMELISYVVLALMANLGILSPAQTCKFSNTGESTSCSSQFGDAANLFRLAADPPSKRGIEKRGIRGVPRSYSRENAKHNFIVQGILIMTEIVNNILQYSVEVGAESTFLATVLFDFGHGTYEKAVGVKGTFSSAQGVM